MQKSTGVYQQHKGTRGQQHFLVLEGRRPKSHHTFVIATSGLQVFMLYKKVPNKRKRLSKINISKSKCVEQFTLVLVGWQKVRPDIAAALFGWQKVQGKFSLHLLAGKKKRKVVPALKKCPKSVKSVRIHHFEFKKRRAN